MPSTSTSNKAIEVRNDLRGASAFLPKAVLSSIFSETVRNGEIFFKLQPGQE